MLKEEKIMALDEYRKISRKQYLTDFSFLNGGEQFPTAEMVGRASVYKFRMKEYSGEYAFDKRLIARVDGGVEQALPYKCISTNYFKLLTNKMSDLVFNTDISIKTGSDETDRLVMRLVERTGFVSSLRKAFKICVAQGDVYLKAFAGGLSVISPDKAVLVVDKHDTGNVKGVVLFENITLNNMNYIRFEIHIPGKIFEIVKQYTNGSIGESVSLNYRGRKIDKQGNWYDTGVDIGTVSKASINSEIDGVYGESLFIDIQDIVFALEQRLSINSNLLDSSMQPFLIVGMDMIETYEDDNGVEHKRLKLVDNGKLLVSYDGDSNVKPVELNYNLDNSNEFIAVLKDHLYELSEMGKVFISGEYSGNVSEETLNNTIKSAIDKGNRLIAEMYDAFTDSLYCLCRINGIDVDRDSLTIVFNIGRTDDDMKVAEVAEKLINTGLMSKQSIREKYYGYTAEQSEVEDKLIQKENEPNVKHSDDNFDKNNENLARGESNEDT